MIVLLDANALIKAPFHQPSWRILGLAGQEWGVDVQIPWVSALEAIGHARRTLEQDAAALKSLARRNRHPGLDQALDDLTSRMDALEDRFVADAEAVGARLIEPVDVPPLTMVRRQVARRKPCKRDGNGFRDTLNWLTFLDVAATSPDQEIVWVSDDGDFTGKDKDTFHQDLLDEAAERGVAGRIALRSSLGSLVTDILAKYGLSTNLNDARRNLAEKAIRTYVLMKVLPSLPEVEPLPEFDRVTFPNPDEISIGQPMGIDDGGATVWSFTTRVQVATSLNAALPAQEVNVSGLVTTDRFDRPTAGEIVNATLSPGAQAAATLIREAEVSSMLQAFAVTALRKNVDVTSKAAAIWPSPTLLADLQGITSASGTINRIAPLLNAPMLRMQEQWAANFAATSGFQKLWDTQLAQVSGAHEQLIANVVGNLDFKKYVDAQLAPLTKVTEQLAATLAVSAGIQQAADQFAKQNRALIIDIARNVPPIPSLFRFPTKPKRRETDEASEADRSETRPDGSRPGQDPKADDPST